MGDAVSAEIDRLWRDGVFRGDHDRLHVMFELNANHPRRDELEAFAVLAALIEDDESPPLRPAQLEATGACVMAIALACRAWAAVKRFEPAEATAALVQLDQAVIEVRRQRPADPRASAALAWADLAIAQCALTGGDRPTARRRLIVILAGEAPLGLALAARITLGAVASELTVPPPGLGILDQAAREAAAAGRPYEAVVAQSYGAAVAMMTGDLEGARQRLTLAATAQGVPVRWPTAARLLLTCLKGGKSALPDIAEGIRMSAAEGDYLAFGSFIVAGARIHAELGQREEAVATLEKAIASLRRTGPGGAALALPLELELERLAQPGSTSSC